MLFRSLFQCVLRAIAFLLDLEQMYMEDRLPLADEVFMTDEEETLFICHNVIAAYKQLIGSDQADLQKLSREMTKAFVTASAIVTRLNRVKK